MTTTDRIVIRTKADLDNAPRRPGGLLLLGGAYLRGADLGDAYLGGAYLGGADLGDAYLRGADLGGADLRGADLRGADLRGAYLRGAYLRGAYLRGADLRDVRGLRGLPLTHGPIGSENQYVTLLPTPTGHTLIVGCWTGTLDALPDEVDRRIAGKGTDAERERWRRQYHLLIEMCVLHMQTWQPVETDDKDAA